MKVKVLTIVILILIVVGYVFFNYANLPFSIKSKGIIYPLREWRIEKNDDGSLKNVLTNYSNNTISYYSVTEFQRGDFAEFVVNESVYKNERIKKGDTIGFIQSNEEQRRYIELVGELAVQENLLRVYTSGVKPEEINVAYEEVLLARHEYEAQKQITDRMKILYKENFISDEEYERSLNNYKSRLHRVNLVKAEYEALMAGDKQERIDYIKSNIEKTNMQLEQVKKRINSFNILSPFAGTIVKQQTGTEAESAIIRLADVSQFIVVIPVELYQLEYLEKGQKVKLNLNSGFWQSIEAEIVDIDNTIQIIDFRQNLFITAAVDMNHANIDRIMPNMIVESKIDCGRIPAKEFLNRFFRTVYQN